MFAGRQRHAEIATYLQEIAEEESGTTLVIDEVDTLRGGIDHNLLLAEKQDFYVQKVKAKEYDIVIATPPCHTFSRAVFANRDGPRPVRDALHPRGFPWLEGSKRKLADEGNVLADFTVEERT